jgi:thioredoxin reductase
VTTVRRGDDAPSCCGPRGQASCCEPAAKAECCGKGTAPGTCGCKSELPVAVIGAGPVGLAAAAHLIARGQTPLVLEAGPTVGASVREWGHVRLFSPWRYNVDAAAAVLLEAEGWTRPPDGEHPTGRELVDRYLVPLAEAPAIHPHLRLRTRVVGVSRRGFDRSKTAGRDQAPFVLRVESDGIESDVAARAVIDASGTCASPNPIGGHGLPALGQAQLADRIVSVIPDVLGRHRDRYAGRRVLVVGGGHSAFNVLLDLGRLAHEAPATHVLWVVRRRTLDGVFGGGTNDQLEERGRLGLAMRALVNSGVLTIETGFALDRLERSADGVVAWAGERRLPPVDEIVAATGFRPDLGIVRELRLAMDPIVESPIALAPLIDPNVHSCGTVPPHGELQLRQPEKDFYIVGMKSYGRAPTFLMWTGYEQVRSVVAALAGDLTAAREVRLSLPETGVCGVRPGPGAGTDLAVTSCCDPTSNGGLCA